MTKKLKDLTLEEARAMCNSSAKCNDCPLIKVALKVNLLHSHTGSQIICPYGYILDTIDELGDNDVAVPAKEGETK